MPRERKRRVCVVTGTRAEFGLMATTLAALNAHPKIELQLIATGMHTQQSRGYTVDEIRRAGWKVNAVVDWPDDPSPIAIARQTGLVTASLAEQYKRLKTDIVLVVGDRVEAFAAATAAHVSGLALAHVHGGDRAMGQLDDALRHAISKLAHVHFAATPGAGRRLFAMGEERARIHVVGAPGVDGIVAQSASRATRSKLGLDYRAGAFLVMLLHPTDADEGAEAARTKRLIDAARRQWRSPIVALLPNSDPGSAGIVRGLHDAAGRGEIDLVTHLSRPMFLGLLRDCKALIGNSSSGIIEAGSFGTPVLDVGPRQAGREHGANVLHAAWSEQGLRQGVQRVLAMSRRRVADNPYDRGGAGRRIARVLAAMRIDAQVVRKLIRY